MTTDELCDFYEYLRSMEERLIELNHKHDNRRFFQAYRKTVVLKGIIFDCIGIKSAYERLERRNKK